MVHDRVQTAHWPLLFFRTELAIAAVVDSVRLSGRRILRLPLYSAEHLTTWAGGTYRTVWE